MNVITIFAALCLAVASVQGHGYLLDPPARSSAWRKGFKTPTDYNDMANFCGGKTVQHSSKNNDMCGVCGEEYTLAAKKLEPGPGNIFAEGVIVGNYKQGETIDITIQTTAYHKGYYEFRLCENNVPQVGKDSSIAVTNECLNKNLLTSAKTGGTRFTASQGESTHQVVLPKDVSCNACVLQWRYRTGNSWGCENGECGLGLGPQEEFIGCADIAIEPVFAAKASAYKPVVTSKTETKAAPMTDRPATTEVNRKTPSPDTNGTNSEGSSTTRTMVLSTLRPSTEPETVRTTQTPAKTTTKASAKVTTKAPVKVTTKAPVKVTTKAPVKVTTQKPAKATTQKQVRVSTTQKALKIPTTQKAVKTSAKQAVTAAAVKPPVKKRKVCKGRAPWGKNMTIYCRQNCLRRINPYCPRSHCTCRLV